MKIIVLAEKKQLGKLLKSICADNFPDVLLNIVEIEKEFWKELEQVDYSLAIISNNSIPADAIPAIVNNLKIQYPDLPLIIISGYDLKGLDYLPFPLDVSCFVETMQNLTNK